MISLRNLDTSKFNAVTGVVLTALTGIAYIQFQPKKYIPHDAKLEPYIRVIGYGLFGLAAYESWRIFKMFKHGEAE